MYWCTGAHLTPRMVAECNSRGSPWASAAIRKNFDTVNWFAQTTPLMFCASSSVKNLDGIVLLPTEWDNTGASRTSIPPYSVQSL